MNEPDSIEFDPFEDEADAWAAEPSREVVLSRRVWSEPTEVWLRGVQRFYPLLAVNPFPRVHLENGRTDYPIRRMAQFFEPGYEWEWVQTRSDHALIGRGDLHGTVYADEHLRRVPVFRYGHDPQELIRLCESFERQGWERLMVGWLPNRQRSEAQRHAEHLHHVAARYPHVKMHLVGSHVFGTVFGLNFHSASWDPSYMTLGDKPMVRLPNGRMIRLSQARNHLKWIHVLGFGVADLADAEGRIRFNVASALWASKFWNSPEGLDPVRARQRVDPLGLLPNPAVNEKGRVNRRGASVRLKFARRHDPDAYPQLSPDPTEPYHLATPIVGAAQIAVGPRKKDNGDRIVCNSCSLAASCRVYREGAICTVSTSPTAKLASLMGTRDAESIKNALSEIIARQADRYERSAAEFRADDGSDVTDLKRNRHLMDMESSLLRSLEALVKIVDPSYRDSVTPAIQNNTMNVYNPRVLVADVIKDLEERGYDRSQLTPEVIQGALEAKSGARVIDGG